MSFQSCRIVLGITASYSCSISGAVVGRQSPARPGSRVMRRKVVGHSPRPRTADGRVEQNSLLLRVVAQSPRMSTIIRRQRVIDVILSFLFFAQQPSSCCCPCQCSRAPTRPERTRPLLVSSMSIVVSVSIYVLNAISLSSIRMFSPIVVPVFAPSSMNTRTVQRYYRETVLTHNEPQITARPVPPIKVRCKMCLRGRRILS